MIWLPGVMICSQAALDRDALIVWQLDCATLQMFSEDHWTLMPAIALMPSANDGITRCDCGRETKHLSEAIIPSRA